MESLNPEEETKEEIDDGFFSKYDFAFSYNENFSKD